MLTIQHVFAVALKDLDVALQVHHALSSDLVVPNPFQRAIGGFLTSFLQEYDALPRAGDWAVWIEGLHEGQAAGVRDALQQIQRLDTSSFTAAYVAETAFEEFRGIATRTAIARLAEAQQHADLAVIEEYAERIRAIQPVNLRGLIDLKDFERFIAPDTEEARVPTGFRKLDQVMGGGIGHELALLMADSGVGKTTGLCNIGNAAALYGARVLHVSCELSGRNTAHRYYRRQAQATRAEFRTDLTTVAGRVRHFLRYMKGSVHILFHEAYALEPEQLRSLCRLFVKETGGLDLLILDYLDLMAPSPEDRRLSQYEQLGRITHKVRNLTAEFGCGALSATQSVRGAGGRRPRLEDMGDSYNKVRGSDIILALTQTDEEAEVYQARLTALKVRESAGKGQEFPIYSNMDLMLMADLDHPNTVRVMEQLGHVPGRRDAAN